MAIAYTFGNHTDVGRVRTQNEDYYGNWVNENGHLFVVCDGMGGHIGGAIASRIAVEAIQTYFLHNKAENPIIAIQKALEYANTCIWQKKAEQPELNGMGTTAVVVLIKDGKVFYAHVGDSRVYHYTNGKLNRITTDHSLVQSLVDNGNITEAEAEKHPNKNQIYKALGIEVGVEPTVCNVPILPKNGDYFLLCTDGLSGLVKDNTIQNIITGKEGVQQKVFSLVELANKNGGTDNITAQLISFGDTETGQTNKGLPLWLKIVTPVVLTFLIVGIWFGFSHSKKTSTIAIPKKTVIDTSKVFDSSKLLSKNPIPKDTIVKITYTIKDGDNTKKLKLKFGYSWNEIKKNNPEISQDEPEVGDKIQIIIQAKVTIPDEIKLADFLDTLAKKYNILKEQIVKTNDIDLKKKNSKLKEIIIPIKK